MDYWKQIAEDRCAVVEAIYASSDPSVVWKRVRGIMREAECDGNTTLVEEAPTAYLPQLQLELVSRFTEQFGALAIPELQSALVDQDASVVAYALLGLSRFGLDTIRRAIPIVASRAETIHSSYGSFGWEGTLAEYPTYLIEHKNDEKA